MISTKRARDVLTKSEFQLYQDSFPRAVKKLSPAQLKQDIKRSRTLRDKYRDLAKRQNREARGKSGPRGGRAAQGSKNTQLKAQIFGETLERFETAQGVASDVVARQTKRAPASKRKVARKKAARKKAGKKATKKKAPAKKRAAGKKAAKKRAGGKKAASRKKSAKKAARRAPAGKGKVGKSPKSRTAAAKARSFERAGSKRGGRHVAARGRRSQARRDGRKR